MEFFPERYSLYAFFNKNFQIETQYSLEIFYLKVTVSHSEGAIYKFSTKFETIFFQIGTIFRQ